MSIARIRVELKPYGRTQQDYERAFKAMHAEFKRRYSDSGIAHILKDHEFHESKSVKARKKLKDSINKKKAEAVEAKILAGVKVIGESKLVKKITNRLKAKKAKQKDYAARRGDKRDFI